MKTNQEKWVAEQVANVISLNEERLLVAAQMIEYGGDFVKNIGQALYSADPTNTERLKKAFPEYWSKYLAWGQRPARPKQGGKIS